MTFEEIPFDATRAAVLEAAADAHCAHAELRIERIRTQYLALRDGEPEGSADDTEIGMGLRIVHNGSIGFAASVETSPEAARELVGRALDAAVITRRARPVALELADEPAHGAVTWSAPYEIDPATVPLSEKIALFGEWSAALLSSEHVDHVSASLMNVTEDKYFADLAGTTAIQRRVRVHPSIEAVALFDDGAGFESIRTCAPPVGRGYEYLHGSGWDFAGELAEMPSLLGEKLSSSSVVPGTYDLVIDPTNLWLTIHESVGHATELDRALGYEAAYAGTSFATFDQLGTLRYGSALMNITGDRTTPYGLATIGYDDEGVAAQSFDLVRDGILVGYQLDRAIAKECGFARSNGCAYGDSPLSIPIQRMANVSLRPGPADGPSTDDLIGGVERGLYIVGDKSWSIDMQRHNFQFTGQRVYVIANGRITGQLRDVAYQGSTTAFWGSLDGLGNPATYRLCGAMNCGKGQPGQVAPVSHGTPSALFRNVNVLNAREESGR